jgi:hypothetical protein
MKNQREVARESSKKKIKTTAHEADEGDDAMSPVTINTRRRDESEERNKRIQYSSELGEESPQLARSWRPSSRPREEGYRSREGDRNDRRHGREEDYCGGHVFYGRQVPSRYAKDIAPFSRSPPRYHRGTDERVDDLYWGSRGRPDRFQESISPPFHPRDQCGRQHRDYYGNRLDRSPPPSSSHGHRLFQNVKTEKDESNKVQLDMKEEPTGKYADLFRADIMSFSKELDSGPN